MLVLRSSRLILHCQKRNCGGLLQFINQCSWSSQIHCWRRHGYDLWLHGPSTLIRLHPFLTRVAGIRIYPLNVKPKQNLPPMISIYSTDQNDWETPAPGLWRTRTSDDFLGFNISWTGEQPAFTLWSRGSLRNILAMR